jgi:hypothetical protein
MLRHDISNPPRWLIRHVSGALSHAGVMAMSKRSCLVAVLGLVLAGSWALVAKPFLEDKPKVTPKVKKITGPFNHANLSIFLLHGDDTITGRKFLTLNEAMEQQKIIVHETSNVNMLAVENTSPDLEIFIQTGDIVKGGRQDRLMSFDLVVPPKSGKVPIPSFCVESGRWRQRGQESAAFFASNTAQASKEMKIAARSGGAGASNQGAVWAQVQKTQTKIAKSLNVNVMANASPSSYQLSIENKELQEKLGAYEKELAGILKDKPDVIGIAYAINGQVEGAEVFACASLCAKQWPKMLKSAAVDAIAELDVNTKFDAPTANLAEAFLKEATGPVTEVAQMASTPRSRGHPTAGVAQDQGGAAQTVQSPGQEPEAAKPAPVQIFQCELRDSLMIESRDTDASGTVLHRSYLRKTQPK